MNASFARQSLTNIDMNAQGIRGLREYVLDRLRFFVQHQAVKPAPIVPAASPVLVRSEEFLLQPLRAWE